MAGRTPLSELLIVDADVHVHESPGALAPYCDPPWDVALRTVADVPGALPRHPRLLARRRRHADRALPDLARGDADGPHAGADGERAGRDRRRPGGAVPRPPAEARRAAAGRLRRGAGARLQRVADRGVDVAPSRAARRDRRLPAGPGGRRARDRAPRRPAAVARLPAVRRPRPALGRPPLRPDLRRRAERRPAGAAARRDRHLAGVPVQQPRVRHRVRAPLDVAHVLDHGQRHQHGLDGRGRALPAS